MKPRLILSTLLCIVISAATFAQSPKKKAITVKKGSVKAIVGQEHFAPKNTDHIGNWKLISLLIYVVRNAED